MDGSFQSSTPTQFSVFFFFFFSPGLKSQRVINSPERTPTNLIFINGFSSNWVSVLTWIRTIASRWNVTPTYRCSLLSPPIPALRSDLAYKQSDLGRQLVPRGSIKPTPSPPGHTRLSPCPPPLCSV